MKNRGFTLIETIIYIALLGLIMTGAIVTSYELIQSSAHATVNTTVQDEGEFVLRKIEWALSGASAITGSGSNLAVTRFDGNTVNFRLNGSVVEMQENATGAYLPITTSGNVKVQSLQFTVSGSNLTSLAVIVSIKTANGTDSPLPFILTKYLRI